MATENNASNASTTLPALNPTNPSPPLPTQNHTHLNGTTTPPPFNPFASGLGYPEFPPRCTNVVRGFPVHNDDLPFEHLPPRHFPPPSNAVYERAVATHFAASVAEALARGPRTPTTPVPLQTLLIRVHEDGFREVVVERGENERLGYQFVRGGWGMVGGGSTGFGTGAGSGSSTSGVSSGVGLGIMLKERVGEGNEEMAAEMEEGSEAGEIEEVGESGGEESDMDSNLEPEHLTEGEILDQTVDFQGETCVTTPPGISGDIYPDEEQPEDSIDEINSPVIQLDYCTVCMKDHIPPGPPMTLADRDTCGSLIPKWFPSYLVSRPWDTYRALINDLVALEEKAQQKDNPAKDMDKPAAWNLKWHEADSEWVAAGRREGWWRCRGGPDAPVEEQTCRVCHGEDDPSEEELTIWEEGEMLAERKKILQGFVDEQSRLFGELDEEIALAKLHLQSLDEEDAVWKLHAEAAAAEAAAAAAAAESEMQGELDSGGSEVEGSEIDGSEGGEQENGEQETGEQEIGEPESGGFEIGGSDGEESDSSESSLEIFLRGGN
jgi:hypothetical protein